MKTGRGVRLAVHRCAMAGCPHMIARRHFLCTDHYALVPKWLQVKLSEQLRYGFAWKCHPTQLWLDYRAHAINYVRRACREKFAQPVVLQLTLPA